MMPAFYIAKKVIQFYVLFNNYTQQFE